IANGTPSLETLGASGALGWSAFLVLDIDSVHRRQIPYIPTRVPHRHKRPANYRWDSGHEPRLG
ncbi:MAG TPA: hypothetical protein VFU86_20610, partial [Terriglobales bacterium]|nr:hypothetical protein [Terriglobales bacterium]